MAVRLELARLLMEQSVSKRQIESAVRNEKRAVRTVGRAISDWRRCEGFPVNGLIFDPRRPAVARPIPHMRNVDAGSVWRAL